jgi:hypothetical protein
MIRRLDHVTEDIFLITPAQFWRQELLRYGQRLDFRQQRITNPSTYPVLSQSFGTSENPGKKQYRDGNPARRAKPTLEGCFRERFSGCAFKRFRSVSCDGVRH